MMKGSSLINKPIITADRGEQIYRVDDVVFEPVTGELIALLAEAGSLFSRAKIVPFQEISAIGDDVITIKTKNSVIPAENDERVKKYMQEDHKIKGKRVVTEDGDEIGRIVDFEFDEESGRVTNYGLSAGALVTLYQGRANLLLNEIRRVGEDVVFVSPEAKSRIAEEAKTRGLQGAARSVKERASLAGEQLRAGTEQLGERAGTAMGGARERARTYAHEFQDQAPEAGSRVAEWWSDTRERVQGWTGQKREQLQERRIKKALGRPTTRVIYDENDDVILDTGDLITHEAIDRAERAGMLDVLLDSVYIQEPDLTTEDLKAKRDE